VGKTLASASTMEADLRAATGDKSEKAKRVGELVAERAKAAGVKLYADPQAPSSHVARRVRTWADCASFAGQPRLRLA